MSSLPCPVANPLVVLREEFDDWAVLYNPDTAAAVGINPVGVSIWKLIDGARGADQIARVLATQYTNDSDADIEADTRAFIADLTSKGFLGTPVRNTAGGDHA